MQEQLPTTAWMQEVEQCRSNCRDVPPFSITPMIENEAMKNKQGSKIAFFIFRVFVKFCVWDVFGSTAALV